jgi:hypothetical protein
MDWPFTKLRDVNPWQRAGRATHSKTDPGRLIEWAGIWEGQAIRFISEPKLINTDLYFLTSSNARIQFARDLGACYVELRVVHGNFSPESLERLQKLAQAFDTRPVRIKQRKGKHEPKKV